VVSGSFDRFRSPTRGGVGIQSLMTLSVGLCPLLIFLASFVNKQAEWKLTRFDITCGALSLLGLAAWQITKVGDVAIASSIIADGLAAIPTVVKAYKFPETETPWPWIAAAISGLFTTLTITNWTFANYGFPIYIFLIDILIYLLVQFRIGKRFKLL
jgi:hypothetical protein